MIPRQKLLPIDLELAVKVTARRMHSAHTHDMLVAGRDLSRIPDSA